MNINYPFATFLLNNMNVKSLFMYKYGRFSMQITITRVSCLNEKLFISGCIDKYDNEQGCCIGYHIVLCHHNDGHLLI